MDIAVTKDDSGILLEVMVAMAAADGTIDEREASTISGIYKDIVGRDVSESQVKKAAEERKRQGTDLIERLRAAASELDRSAKERIVRAAYLVLLADDAIAGSERKKLKDIATALKIPEVHFGAILEDVAVWLQQRGQ